MSKADVETGGPARAPVTFVGDGAIPRDAAAEAVIQKIRRVRGVERITALPDACMANLEAPMSMVTEMRGWLVPAVATNVMNCGVGVIDTGLHAEELRPDDIEHLLRAIWNASTSPDYEISAAESQRFFLQGVDALRGMGIFEEADQMAFEFGGNVLRPEDSARIDFEEIVPFVLRHHPETRTPARLRLKGNHFLEAHAIEDVIDPARLERFGLREGRLLLMLHMDHRVTGGLNLHYVTRKKLREAKLRKRVPYELSRLQFHFGNPAKWQRSPERLRYYFLEHGYASLPMDSLEGCRYRDAYALGTNYGYAGRGIIYRLCLDSLRREFGVQPRILWDTNHESIRFQETEEAWTAVVRKGAIQCFPSRPAFLLGHYDVPSFLGECAGSEGTAFSYDHGSKHVRRAIRGGDALDRRARTVARFVISGGSKRFEDAIRENAPLKSNEPMDVLARRLSERGAVHRVAWLRPLANLSEA